VLLQMLCNYKPSLYDELGFTRHHVDRLYEKPQPTK